jgi:hypothetical protein
MSKPPFKMRTIGDAVGVTDEMIEDARKKWSAYYRKNPKAAKERRDLEIRTIENMVQQYVDQYGFRPDEYPEKWWEKK